MMNDITFEQAWNYGGPLMWVLAGISVFGLAVVLYLWIAQSRFVFLKSAYNRVMAAKDREAAGGRIAARRVDAGCEFGDHAHRVGVVDIQSHLSKRMRKPHRVVERYEGTRLIRITFGEQLDDDAIRHFRTMHGGGGSR